MATYVNLFSGYSTGQPPDDWTERWITATAAQWSVESGPVLRAVTDTNYLDFSYLGELLSWDAVDVDAGADNVEVLVKARINSQYGRIVVVARANENDGYECVLSLNDAKLYIFRIEEGRHRATVAYQYLPYAVPAVTPAPDTWYWIRYRVNGTSHRAKVWEDGSAEPAAWAIDATDSAIQGAGWVGCFAATASSDTVTMDVEQIAVATAGGTAEILPEGPAAVTEADDAVSAAGYFPPTFVGTASVTESDDGAAGAGIVYPTGAGAVAETDDTAAGHGNVYPAGSGAITEADDTAAMAGAAGPAGPAAVTEADDTATVTGTFIYWERAIQGDWVTYRLTLEGSPDIVIPISSFQLRRRSGEISSLVVTAPSVTQAEAIGARSGHDLVLTMTAHFHGGASSSGELVRATLEEISLDEGGRSQTVTLTGRVTATFGDPKIVAVSGASYRRTDNGVRTLRCAINYGLRPGDTVEDHEGNRWVTEEIVYYVGVTNGGVQSLMEAKEAA